MLRTAVLILLACLSPLAARGQETLRALFLGNSYTFVNDLPGLVSALADAAGHFPEMDSHCPGGWTLGDHLASGTSRDRIAEGWDVVVLQEQSQLPTIPGLFDSLTVPAARGLDSLAALAGARTVFFMTWGRELGGQQCWDEFCSPDFADFFQMQDSLSSAYRGLSAGLQAGLAPAGDAWALARHADPGVALWSDDHSHPSLEGSYLAACVFLQELFGGSAVGLGETGGLPAERALWLQEQAAGLLPVVPPRAVRPDGLRLSPPWPNPFNPRTTVAVELDRPGELRVEVRDLGGRLVEVLADGLRASGRQRVDWRPVSAASGPYWILVRANGRTEVRPVTLLR